MFDSSIDIIRKESRHLFICFCTFINTLKGKKLSVQNVFVITLEEERLKKIIKNLLSLDSDQELVRVFLDFDPTIAKSKYVTKYINQLKKHKTTEKKKK